MLHIDSMFHCRKAIVLGLTGGLLLVSFSAHAVPIPGPDNFGYTGEEIGFDLRDLTTRATSTLVNIGDDEMVGDIPIGFEFDFYGLRYDEVAISSSGYLALGEGIVSSNHATPIPSPEGPANFIAGLYTDLLVYTPELKELFDGTGDVYYETRGPTGAREFAVGFYNVQEFGGTALYTFEMILHEGSQNIEFQIDRAPRGVESFSIGIEDATSNDGLSVVSNLGGNDELVRCGGACDPTAIDSTGFLFTHPTGTLGPWPPEPGAIPVDRGNDPGDFLEIKQANDTVRWEVGVTTTVTTDGTGGTDPFAYHGPAFTVYEGEFLDPAQSDAYDRANIVALALPGEEGEAVHSSHAELTPYSRDGKVSTLPSGATLVEGERYTMDNGVDAKLSYYFSDQAAIVRTMVEFTNETGSPITDAVVNFANPMGSDDSTWVIATANNPNGGDPTQITDPQSNPPSETFRYEDRWIVTDEDPLTEMDGGGDPATTHVYFGPEGRNAGLDGNAPQLAFNGAPDDPDDLYTLLRVDLPPGETTALMFFSELTRTHAEALDGVDKYSDLDHLRDAGLLEGIHVGTPIYNWGTVRTALLQAGDADEDYDFDQFDVIKVQTAAKYLSGELATWGEGDWNGAPGGYPGNPPPGDGRFDQADVLAALGLGLYRSGPYAAISPGGSPADSQTSIIYNANTGEIAIDAPADAPLTSVNIDSASGIFVGQDAQNLGGSFDNDTDTNLFKATFGSSFGSISLGDVALPGLDETFLLGDLTVIGSRQGGGGLGNVDLIYIPEPSSVALLFLGLFGIAASRRHLGPLGRGCRLVAQAA